MLAHSVPRASASICECSSSCFKLIFIVFSFNTAKTFWAPYPPLWRGYSGCGGLCLYHTLEGNSCYCYTCLLSFSTCISSFTLSLKNKLFDYLTLYFNKISLYFFVSKLKRCNILSLLLATDKLSYQNFWLRNLIFCLPFKCLFTLSLV